MNFLEEYAEMEKAHIYMRGCEIIVGMRDFDTMNEFNNLYDEIEMSNGLVTDVQDWAHRKNLDCIVWFGNFVALSGNTLTVLSYPIRMELNFFGKREKIWQLVSYFATNDARNGSTLLNLKNWAETRKIFCKIRFFGWKGLTLWFKLWLHSRNGQWPVKPVKRLF